MSYRGKEEFANLLWLVNLKLTTAVPSGFLAAEKDRQ